MINTLTAIGGRHDGNGIYNSALAVGFVAAALAPDVTVAKVAAAGAIITPTGTFPSRSAGGLDHLPNKPPWDLGSVPASTRGRGAAVEMAGNISKADRVGGDCGW